MKKQKVTLDIIENNMIKLRMAIKFKNKKAIMEAYDILEYVDWQDYPTEFDAYDQLVTKANNILYS